MVRVETWKARPLGDWQTLGDTAFRVVAKLAEPEKPSSNVRPLFTDKVKPQTTSPAAGDNWHDWPAEEFFRRAGVDPTPKLEAAE